MTNKVNFLLQATREAVPALPLPMLGAGQTAQVTGIAQAGRISSQKLVAMGILPGVKITVLNTQSGPIMLRIGEGRFAIGRGLAQRILVQPCS